jgi:hypothetical protein
MGEGPYRDAGSRPKPSGFSKPLYVDSRFLRPLPQAMWDTACSKCDKRQSRWDFVPTDNPPPSGGFPLCTLCWLYESEWGKERREQIDAMIRDVEKTSGKIFQRAKGNRLWACKDADPILGSIVMTSRMFELQAGRPRE